MRVQDLEASGACVFRVWLFGGVQGSPNAGTGTRTLS